MLFKPSQRLLSLLSVPILLTMIGCGGTDGGTAVEVPTSDDSGLLSDGSFEFGSDAWTGNASNPQPEEGNETNTVNYADVAVAGQAFDVNLSQVLPIVQGKRYTLSFRGRTNEEVAARSGESFAARTASTRTIFAGIGLNEEPWTNVVQEITLTKEWQEFILTLDAKNFGLENSRILFDMGADTGLVLLDDVVLEEMGDIPTPPVVEPEVGDDQSELLTNGSFENGNASWAGNAANVTDELLGVDGSFANFANVEAAGDAFNVNLSQVVVITEGETYTLTFQAKSDGNRSMLAGIGLNEEPWTNNSKTVALTTEWQTFTLTLAASDFGGSNSRVLFDMGAETGQVIIDEVSLKVAGESSVDEGSDTNSNDDATDDGAGFLYTSDANANSLDFKADVDFSFGEWGSGSELEGNYTDDATYSPVFQVISGSGWGAPAAALAFYNFEAGFAKDYGCLTFKVKDLPLNQLFVKFTSGGQPETEIRIDASNWTDLSGDWKAVSVPMSGFPNTASYTEFGIHTGYGNGGTILLTDIAFTDNVCAEGTGSGAVISGVGSPTPPFVAPPNLNDGVTYLFTTNPTANPWDLLPDTHYKFSDWGSGSLFNGAYSADLTYNPVFEVKSGNNWSGGGDHNAVIAFYDFAPGFAENHGCLVFKVKDFPTDNVNIKFASPDGAPEKEVSLVLADHSSDLTAGWKAISIPMSNFPDVASYDQFGIFSQSTSSPSTLLITDIGLTDAACSTPPPTAPIPTPAGADFIQAVDGSAPAIVAETNYTLDTWGNNVAITLDADVDDFKAITVDGSANAEGWGSTIAFTGLSGVSVASYENLVFKVKGLDVIRVKFPPAEDLILDVATSGTPVAGADGWYQMTVPLASYGDPVEFAFFGHVGEGNNQAVYHLSDVGFTGDTTPVDTTPIPTPAGADFIQAVDGSAPAIVAGTNYTLDTWGNTVAITFDAEVDDFKAITVDGSANAEGWGSTIAFTGLSGVSVASYENLVFKVKGLDVIRVKFPPAEDLILDVATSGTPVAGADGWYQMTVPLASYGDPVEFAFFGHVGEGNNQAVYHLSDVGFTGDTTPVDTTPIPTPAGADFIQAVDGSAPAIVAETNYTLDTWGNTVAITFDAEVDDFKAITVDGSANAEGWGSTIAFTGLSGVSVASYENLVFKVKGLDVIRVKFPPAEDLILDVATSGTPVAGADGWYQITVPLASYGDPVEFAFFGHVGEGNNQAVYHLSDVGFSGMGGSGGSGGSDAPTTSAPTPPARDAADVVSIYSDSYSSINVNSWHPGWGESNGAIDEVSVAGNSTRVIDLTASQTFGAIDYAASGSQDLSGFTHMHIDYYVASPLPAGLVIIPKLSNHNGGAGETSAIQATLPVATGGQWVSIDIPLGDFTAAAANGILDRNAIAQILFTVAMQSPEAIKVYFDNLYFY